MIADVWTDHEGHIHERLPGEPGLSLCGLNAGEPNRLVAVRPCRACLAESLRRYARTHDCAESGCGLD